MKKNGKLDISSASEKAFPFCLAISFVHSLPPKRCVLIYIDCLALCQWVSSQRRTARTDISVKTKESMCLVIVELTPYTYTSLRETLCFVCLLEGDSMFQVCLFALNRHGHADVTVE